MMKTDKLLPLINKINQDKKKLNNSKPNFALPDKTQAKLDAKPIITNQDGQDLFPGIPTLIKGKGAGTPITMRNTNPQIALTPYGAAFMQPNMNYNFAGNSVLELPAAQMGGDPQQDQTMQIIQIYAQMKQMDPNELIKKIQALPQDQQQEALQSISQEVQQAMAQQEQAQAGQEGQEPMPEEGMMSYGGEPCIDCFDKYNPSPQAQNLEWFYKKAKGGLTQHQGQKSQVGKTKLGDFQVGLGKFDGNQFRQNVISTQPAATGSGTSVPYNMEEDLRMQQLAAQKMGQYHNNIAAFDSANFASTIPTTMNQMVNGIEVRYPKGSQNVRFKNQNDVATEYPANYFWTDDDILNRHKKPYANEYYSYTNDAGELTDNKRTFNNPADSYNLTDFAADDLKPRNPYIVQGFWRNFTDQRNPDEIRQGQQAAYDAWQKGDKLTKSYLTDEQINQLAQRMVSGQNFSDVSYQEMLSVPDYKKVQQAAGKLGKKAKGGMALPKHQWATSQTGTTQLGNPTMNPYLLQKIQESMQTQNTKAAPTTQDILNEARKMPVMTNESTSVAAAQQNKKQLDKDTKDYGTFENAEKAKTIKKAQKEQEQSQLYETVDINPNEYASAAMSSPYYGNNPRIIRDAANQTNKGMAPPAAGLLGTIGLPALSHAAHEFFSFSPTKFFGYGMPSVNVGNAFAVDMVTDAIERSPAWGNALDKAMTTGNKEDFNELLRLSALQGIDLSAIAAIPGIISSGAKLPKALEKIRNAGSAGKFAQTIKEFEGLVHLGKKYSKGELKEKEDPTKGKWGRYASALMGPDGIMGTNPDGMQSFDQTFIPESTGVYPNYLNIPQNVATDFYGSRKEGGEAFPQAN